MIIITKDKDLSGKLGRKEEIRVSNRGYLGLDTMSCKILLDI